MVLGRTKSKNKRDAPPLHGSSGLTSGSTIDDTHIGKTYDDATLGPKTGASLEELELRRNRFLRCSGMHSAEIWSIVHGICKGEINGPGLSYGEYNNKRIVE